MRKPALSLIITGSLVAATFALEAPATAARQDADAYYSYALDVHGSATLFSAGSEARSDLTANLPLLVGDRIWVAPSGRADLLLSDTNRLSVDRNTEVRFQALAFSPDSTDEATGLALDAGRIAVEVVWLAEGQPLWIDTRAARVYLHRAGNYVILADGETTEVIVRSGFAEVVDQRGSSVVRDGESTRVEGFDEPTSVASAAPPPSGFERWAKQQGEVLASGDSAYLDEPLRVAGSLEGYGNWVQVDGQRAWRPGFVSSSWQPYYHGRWRPTPSGLYWVSSDPWPSVTWQYGTWNRHPAQGWLWYPGAVYAPAHVYWYWGSTYSGWVPTGYYQHYYRGPSWGWGAGFGFSYGFNWGVYGWAGGSWGHYNNWVFCPVRYVGYPRQYQHHDYGHRMKDYVAKQPRGILTTDTRGINSSRLRRPELAQDTLIENYQRTNGGASREMPDVTPFVERGDGLPNDVRGRMIASQPVERSGAASRTAPRLESASSPDRVAATPSGRGAAGASASGRTLRPSVPAARSLSDGGTGRSRVGPTTSPSGRQSAPSASRGALEALPGRTFSRNPGPRESATSARTPTRLPSTLRPTAPQRSTPQTSVRPPTSRRPSTLRPTAPQRSTPQTSVRPPTSRRPSAAPATRPQASPSRRPSGTSPPSQRPGSGSTLRSPATRSPRAQPPTRSARPSRSAPRVSRPPTSRPSSPSRSVRPPSSSGSRSRPSGSVRPSGSSRSTPSASARPSGGVRSSRSQGSSRGGASRSTGSRSSSRSRPRTGPPPAR